MLGRFIKAVQRAPRSRVLAAVAVTVGVALLGYTIVASRAAGPNASLEPENASLSGGATSVTDSAASGGRALKFGSGSGGGTGPLGLSGNWTQTFGDEFNGSSLDSSKWSPNWYGEGGNMNNVGTYAENVAVTGGNLVLTLASQGRGALVHSDYTAGRYQLPVGQYVEARVYFPGNGTTIYNWPAWWASGPNWPAAGEHDIAEGLGQLSSVYHSPSDPHASKVIPGTWSNAFHVYGVYRKAGSADVYWDGAKVNSYNTDDNGNGQELIFNVGGSGTYGTASQVKVDWVRAWAPATTGGTKKVMPLGDSVTDGYDFPGGYRTQLWNRLVNQNHDSIDFVGSQSNGPSSLPDKNHEGHSGWCIDGSCQGAGSLSANVQNWINTYQPDVILLHAGTNDLNQSNGGSTAASRMDAMLGKIFTTKPGVRVVLAKLIPMYSGHDADWQAYNNALPGLVSKYQGQGRSISLVDMTNVISQANGDYNDLLHPNTQGYSKMGDAWYNAVSQYVR